MNEDNNTLGLSQEDREALELIREQKKQADIAKARKQRLNDFINGEGTKDYAKELLESGLQADIDANPHLLDSQESFKYAASVALRNYKASQQTSQQATQQEEQPKQEQSSEPLTPNTVVSSSAPQPKQQEQTIDWGRVTHKELEEKHGLSKGLSRMAAAFPPNKFIEQ